jgi:hypothetical protein
MYAQADTIRGDRANAIDDEDDPDADGIDADGIDAAAAADPSPLRISAIRLPFPDAFMLASDSADTTQCTICPRARESTTQPALG